MEEQLRSALAGGLNDGNVVMLVIPAAVARNLLGGASTESAGPADPELDYSVKAYREKFDPDTSLGRIREWCAEGYFPASISPDGTLIPGAYKDSTRNWRITREGILERQRRERMTGVGRHSQVGPATDQVKPGVLEAPLETIDAEEEVVRSTPYRTAPVSAPSSVAASGAKVDQPRQITRVAAGATPQRTARKKEGAWRKARGVC